MRVRSAVPIEWTNLIRESYCNLFDSNERGCGSVARFSLQIVPVLLILEKKKNVEMASVVLQVNFFERICEPSVEVPVPHVSSMEDMSRMTKEKVSRQVLGEIILNSGQDCEVDVPGFVLEEIVEMVLKMALHGANRPGGAVRFHVPPEYRLWRRTCKSTLTCW